MTDSKFITFDQVFDKEEIRKKLTGDVERYYDTTKNPAVQKDTSELVSKHIDKLGKSIALVKGMLRSQYYAIPVGDPSTPTKEGDIEKLISLFYLFPFSNSKIKPGKLDINKSTSKNIKTAPIKDGIGDKIVYFESPGSKPNGNPGQPGTISAKTDKTYTIKIDGVTKSSVKKDQLIFLERTTDGETSEYLDEAVYKKYIEIHGIKVVELLESLQNITFKEAEKKYVDFVEKTDFGNIEALYASNKFSTISIQNKTEPPAVSPGSTGSPGSPGSPGSATPGSATTGSPASPATSGSPQSKKLKLNCALTNDTGAGGRRRRRKTLKKRNTMKNRKTLKKRKATRRRKSTKKRKTTKTKRVRFKM